MAAKNLIFLTGFSGSGKSTVGARLAKRLRVRFIDIDRVIKKTAHSTIPALFRSKGERAFRQLERATIEETMKRTRRPAVIALGGGALLNEEVRRDVLNLGTLIYLSCPVSELYRRLKAVSDRPLLTVRPKPGETPRQARLRRIKALLNKRLPGYRRAHIILSTSCRTPAEAARELEQTLRSRHDHA